MPAGRPSPYKKKFCKEMIDMATEGKTSSQWAKSFGVCQDTIHEWRKVHPEFSAAYKLAIEAAKAWVSDQAKEMVEQGTTAAQLNALKFFAGATLRMRENDSKEEIEEAVKNQLPKFTTKPDALT